MCIATFGLIGVGLFLGFYAVGLFIFFYFWFKK